MKIDNVIYELDDPADLIQFAQTWMDLGSAVTKQVAAILRGDNPLEQNYIALSRAQTALSGFNRTLDDALHDAIAAIEEEEDDQPEEVPF